MRAVYKNFEDLVNNHDDDDILNIDIEFRVFCEEIDPFLLYVKAQRIKSGKNKLEETQSVKDLKNFLYLFNGTELTNMGPIETEIHRNVYGRNLIEIKI